MRRGYCLQEHDEDYLIPIMEALVWRLEQEDIDDIGPLKDLGLEPWDENLTSNYLNYMGGALIEKV